jgi:hypothetical protein
MATNPKIPPDEKNSRDDHSHVVLTRKRSNPWPLILAIIASIILIALIAWVILTRPIKSSKPSATAVGAAQTQAFLVEHFEFKPV